MELDDGEMARKYGADSAVPEWRERPVCFRRDRRNIDMVVTGTKWRKRARGQAVPGSFGSPASLDFRVTVPAAHSSNLAAARNNLGRAGHNRRTAGNTPPAGDSRAEAGCSTAARLPTAPRWIDRETQPADCGAERRGPDPRGERRPGRYRFPRKGPGPCAVLKLVSLSRAPQRS